MAREQEQEPADATARLPGPTLCRWCATGHLRVVNGGTGTSRRSTPIRCLCFGRGGAEAPVEVVVADWGCRWKATRNHRNIQLAQSRCCRRGGRLARGLVPALAAVLADVGPRAVEGGSGLKKKSAGERRIKLSGSSALARVQLFREAGRGEIQEGRAWEAILGLGCWRRQGSPCEGWRRRRRGQDDDQSSTTGAPFARIRKAAGGGGVRAARFSAHRSHVALGGNRQVKPVQREVADILPR